MAKWEKLAHVVY